MNIINRPILFRQVMLLCVILSSAFAPFITVYGAYQDSSQTIYSIAWSSDGSKIAVGRSGRIDILNASNQILLKTLTGNKGRLFAIDWSSDSTKVAGASLNPNGLTVWDVSTGQIIASRQIDAVSAHWNPDNIRIASASTGGGIAIWNTLTGDVTVAHLFGTELAWSPDGSKLAYAYYDESPVSVTNITTGQQVMTLMGNTQGVEDVDWSPDGTKIASAGSDNTVRVWNAVTGAPLHTFTGHSGLVRSVQWNPNSSMLASGSSDGTIRFWDMQTFLSLGVIQVGSKVKAITWSPDGSRLAYGGDEGIAHIVTPFRNGTGLRGQYFDASNFTVPKFFRLNASVDYNWGTLSPDAALAADTFSVRWTGKVESLYSEAITFYVTHNDGARLWVNGQPIINNWTNTTNAVTDSGTITLAAGVKTDIVLEYYDNTGSASVKLEWQSARQARQVIPSTQLYPPEGQLAYTARSGGVDSVMIANPDGTETVQVFGTNAAWSPDGSQVAFITSAYDGNPELYVVNADGSGFPRRLTNHTAAESEPCWSPDSTKIIFASARTGGGDIYVVTVVGTSGVPTATRLTTAVDKEYQPTWSPNGLKITYSRDTTTSGGPEIYMMDANGANVTRLTTRNGYDISPYWSPDGSKIAIRGNISGRDQIWVITLSPRSVTQLTASAGGNYFQSWSPNGSKILFLSTRDGQAEVYTMNSDGTAQTNLSNTASTVESYAVWSADARQIAYIREGDVWMMNADGSNPHGLIVTPNRTEREIVWWQAKQIN